MDGLKLRPATAADIATLRRFEQQIVAAERPHDPTLRDGLVHYYDLERMVQQNNVLLLVAEQDGEPIGCGFARIDAAQARYKHARQAYLGLMYVEPRQRGRGVNQRILDELLAWCRAHGITELRLEVYTGNASAVRAYEKAGFSAHLLEMRLALDPAEDAPP
jgi:GNAT superfamily N-acetyltransferase